MMMERRLTQYWADISYGVGVSTFDLQYSPISGKLPAMSTPPHTLTKCQLSPEASTVLLSHLPPSLLKTIQTEQWRLGDRQFRDITAVQLFQQAVWVEAVTIWLDFNKKPNIIADIIRPTYSHLRVLYLGDNNISSLEALPLLDAPLLERLLLNHNRIASLKSLRKCIFPQLLELNLNGNPLIDQQWLSEAHFPALDKLSLGYKKNGQRIDQYAWFLKAEIRNQTQIISPYHRLYNFNRISFFNSVKDATAKRMQPKDLFKTFEK